MLYLQPNLGFSETTAQQLGASPLAVPATRADLPTRHNIGSSRAWCIYKQCVNVVVSNVYTLRCFQMGFQRSLQGQHNTTAGTTLRSPFLCGPCRVLLRATWNQPRTFKHTCCFSSSMLSKGSPSMAPILATSHPLKESLKHIMQKIIQSGTDNLIGLNKALIKHHQRLDFGPSMKWPKRGQPEQVWTHFVWEELESCWQVWGMYAECRKYCS